MIKTIIIIIAIFVGLNYMLMAGTVLLGKWAGYETECNPLYCKFTSKSDEVYCTKYGMEVDCDDLKDWEKLENMEESDGVMVSFAKQSLINYLEGKE